MKTTVFQGQAKVTYKEKKSPVIVQIRSSRDVQKVIKDHLKGANLFEREIFVAVYMNRANEVLWIETVGVGTAISCTPDITAITRRALTGTSTSLIVAHNHPSGNIHPSESDRRFTKDLKSALDLFNISLLDHLIIGKGEKYYSMSDNGERSLA
jgi:DNA repair protein RadC